ncbi:transposase [Candidatus Nitrotoga arctica]|uniref:transposase n=1 Tax=Candidatus Nitrotoga arctica TaxID=453162 RepID=UPI003B967FE1
MQVAGQIQGNSSGQKKHIDFQVFLDDAITEEATERGIYIILDNLSTHKGNADWLAAHPNGTLHFTPASANWLNQIKI